MGDITFEFIFDIPGETKAEQEARYNAFIAQVEEALAEIGEEVEATVELEH